PESPEPCFRARCVRAEAGRREVGVVARERSTSCNGPRPSRENDLPRNADHPFRGACVLDGGPAIFLPTEQGVIMRFVFLSTVATMATTFVTVPALASNLVVKPGQSIQAAVDRALPGDVVLVQPGTYQEAGRPCPTDASSTCAVVVTQSNV